MFNLHRLTANDPPPLGGALKLELEGGMAEERCPDACPPANRDGKTVLLTPV